MAIGKAGAYATVEGPKVDFGDIALNAQKIQQADLDRIKSMIPEEKKSDFKIKDIDTGIKKTGNGGYDQTLTSFLDDVLVDNLAIDNEAEALGRYTPELMAKKQKLQNEVTGLKGLSEKFTNDTIGFAKKLDEGVFSSVDKSRFDIIEDIAAKRNLEISKDDNGNTVFKIRMVDKDGAFLSDTNKKPLYKSFNDRGVNRDYITKYELENGSLFGNSIKELDRTKTINEIQNTLKLRTTTKDATGVVSTTKKDLTQDDYSYINSSVNGVLSNYDNLTSYLYSLDREKYASPKTIEEYKKNGDIDFAAKEMKRGILAGLGFEYKEDRIAPKNNNGDGGDDTDKGLFVFQPKSTPLYETGKVGKKRTGGYQISLNAISGKSMAQGMDKPVIIGKTSTGDRYIELALSGGEGETGKSGSGASESSRQSSKGGASGRIYLTGDKADAARAEQYLNYINYGGKKVNDLGTLIQIIDNAPKLDFDSRWAKLRSGQKLVGPNGKTYIKK